MLAITSIICITFVYIFTIWTYSKRNNVLNLWDYCLFNNSLHRIIVEEKSKVLLYQVWAELNNKKWKINCSVETIWVNKKDITLLK